MKYLRILCFLFVTISCVGQSILTESKHIVVDTSHRIAIWSLGAKVHDQMLRDSVRTSVNGPVYAISSDFKWLFNEQDTLMLVKTKFPLIHITSLNTIVDEPKRLAQIQYIHHDTILDLPAGIELRGNSALRYPKKSYDLEFRDPENTEESFDVRLEDMREDDDWILNSIYNEPLRLRSHFSNDLWQAISADHKSLKGYGGIRDMYVEVFLNNTYQGLYLLSEQVDRKLLQLKKKKGDTVRGELFKAGSYQPGTRFEDAPPFNNAFPTWAGFEMDYPYDDFTAHYDDLAKFVQLVSNGSDGDFNGSVTKWIDLENAIDYFLFVNLLRATDNLGKNYFLARTDRDDPYYFVPWDLDGVLGTIQDGKRIPTTNDILSNGLFDRLWENDPANYRDRVKSRWKELRAGAFSNDHLFSKIERLYTGLSDLEVYEREKMLWGGFEDLSGDYQYLTTWLKSRLDFLDKYFEIN